MTTGRIRTAIIGSGISGLTSAWLLAPHQDVTIFEASSRPGGHARTRQVDGIAVDTGFIVCNRRTYPLFIPLLEHLGVELADSDMSFAASFQGGKLEYGTTRALDMFAQKRRLLDPAHWRMIRDTLRFFKQAHGSVRSGESIGALLARLGLGDTFRDRFLMPISGAIWSTPTREMADFPAAAFIDFFENHGLLSVDDQPQWLTVRGGSARYVEALLAATDAKLRLSCPVGSVLREAGGLTVASAAGKERFDRVVFATHAPQALALLAGTDAQERDILSGFRTEPNRMVLHSDISFLPKTRKIWSSWNYVTDAAPGPSDRPISLSYWMNRLQPLGADKPLIVTLNPEREPAQIHDEAILYHPQFDAASAQAQARLPQIQGRGGVHFAGAWTRYGFHEDGVLSALRVAQDMGLDWPLGPDPWAEERIAPAPVLEAAE
ncbi:FAD-dependent oxidoreductase [Salipiger sp. 1_MG-2023]|uniref:NAD(P)/FAD-dependent oxidoreductase n=1 Tax=Salipiger sp. 1_MG-2023 TaxID=3062665 RepID=UPI0026E32A40|nr:FAD-dependent oxidoreductase [Salipiger sp. 1_MG-2023]MDO6584473.1 FAD-dependent oxidoreductase [Salipiger sp. 1_MG-2023]